MVNQLPTNLNRPLTIAWISSFPVEWLEDVPAGVQSLPRQHPASWQRVLLAEFEKRTDLRLHIFVLRKHFTQSQTFERRGVVFHLIKTVGGLRAPSCYWLDTFLLRREMAQIEPDVVHAWGTELGAALVAGRLGFPYVVTMQGLLNWIGQVVPMTRFDRFAAVLEDVALSGTATVTAESSFAMEFLRQRHPQLRLCQIEHPPLPLFHEVVRVPQLNPPKLVFVGSFTYLKGGDTLFQALAQLPEDQDYELVCIGTVDAAFAESLRRAAPERVWNRVRFLGSRTAPEIAAELASAALFVYPTRCDNSPNAVKEAVVAGVPVVASAVGGIVDYVVPDRNGLLFAAGDACGLAQCVSAALKHPVFGCGGVEPECLARMRTYLSAAEMASRFLATYSSVTGGT